MSAVHNAKYSEMRRSGNVDTFSSDGVCLSSQTLYGATVVAATGELDASNIHHLTDYTRSCLTGGLSLVLDLSRLNFLGAQGIRNLFEIADQCERRGIAWALVPSHPVSRLLRICDKRARLPSVSSIDQALEHFSAPASIRGLLQLVPKSR
jgi:anti-anti-sigma factor